MLNLTPVSMLFMCGFLLWSEGVRAADFSIRTVDGLNRPLANVQVTVSCAGSKEADRPYVLMSDSDGVARGTYDEAKCTPRFVGVEKQGYVAYFSGFRDQYELQRNFSAAEVSRVAYVDGVAGLGELRELLAGDTRGLEDTVFLHEKRLRPSLRALAREGAVTIRARDMLALIGEREDIRYILQLPSPPPARIMQERWRYGVATALVQPESEEEWTFLQRCAWGEFFDGWVDAGAIQSLKLNGSARSKEILQAVQGKNSSRARSAESALTYIGSNPKPLADGDLEVLARRVAEALAIGTWEGNEAPRFNQEADKALVKLKFHAGFDYLEYTATFHKGESVWILRGVRETLQAFAPRMIVKPSAKAAQ